MRNKFISTEKRITEFYKGIEIHADEALHSQAFDLVHSILPEGSTILDVGAGAGAFSQRLADHNYQVTGMDIELYEWIPKDIPFKHLDVNKGIVGSVDTQYDAVCSLEVIEHLENPWAFFRELNAIVKPGGKLFLSTPNITSFWSRVYFFRAGHFHGFMPYDVSYGHINPMSAFEIEMIGKNTGWKLTKTIPGGYLPVFDFSEPTKLPLLLSNIVRWIPYILAKGQKNGWCLIFAFEKVDESSNIYKPGCYTV